jgi:hypothetical protein
LAGQTGATHGLPSASSSRAGHVFVFKHVFVFEADAV